MEIENCWLYFVAYNCTCILLGILSLLVQSDSTLAVHAVNVGEQYACMQHMSNLIREIKNLQQCFSMRSINYVSRLGNSVVHKLARSYICWTTGR